MLQAINKDLVPIKAHYFLFNAATGPIVPFLPTIAKQLGFSGILLGIIYTILPISGLIAKPLFGGLADKFHLHKTFFLISQAVVAIGFFTIYFIPSINSNVTLSCDTFASLELCSQKEFSEEVIKVATLQTSYNASCKLSCKALPADYDKLCSYWHTRYFCNSSKTDDSSEKTFEFEAMFDMYNNLPLKNCINLHVSKVAFMDNIVESPKCPAKNGTLRTSCSATCYNNSAINRALQEMRASDSKTTSTYQFHLFLWAAIVSWIGMAVTVSIADAICFHLLGNERQKEYGKQKMWSSIGFGIFGISAGYLVDVFSKDQDQKDYTCIFYIMLIAMILDIIVSATLKKKNPEYSDEQPSVFWELLTLGKDCNVLVFVWWCIGAGICTGVVWNFLFWYTEDLAIASHTTKLKTLQGLLIGVQCFLGELPFNFISGNVLRKLGHVNVMSIVLLVFAIRFMAYSVISNPWLYLLLEILHGPSFGLCWPTMVSYADKVTPSGTKATMQGFIGAIFEGIGVSTGSLLCGWLIDMYGGIITFRVFSVGALLWLGIFWLMQVLLQKAGTYPIQQGHNHLANYANPDDAILMTISQELQTY